MFDLNIQAMARINDAHVQDLRQQARNEALAAQARPRKPLPRLLAPLRFLPRAVRLA